LTRPLLAVVNSFPTPEIGTSEGVSPFQGPLIAVGQTPRLGEQLVSRRWPATHPSSGFRAQQTSVNSHGTITQPCFYLAARDTFAFRTLLNAEKGRTAASTSNTRQRTTAGQRSFYVCSGVAFEHCLTLPLTTLRRPIIA